MEEKHLILSTVTKGSMTSKVPNFQNLPRGWDKSSFIGIDYAALESKMVYGWSNGEGGMDYHTECKDEACDICKPGFQGFDPYTYVAKKHNVERNEVKRQCYHIFYFMGFNPKNKKEMVEGIEKSMGIYKC